MLDHASPFELLVATILAAQCTDAKVNEMIGTLAKAANGASRTVHVLPDGTITLPLLDLVPVAGRTLAEIQAEIKAQWAALIDKAFTEEST